MGDSDAYRTEWYRGRWPFTVLNYLPYLPAASAVRIVTLPVTVDWSSTRRGKPLHLGTWHDCRHVYEQLLRQGTAADIASTVHGPFLVGMWEDLRIPDYIRSEWQSLIDAAFTDRPDGPTLSSALYQRSICETKGDD